MQKDDSEGEQSPAHKSSDDEQFQDCLDEVQFAKQFDKPNIEEANENDCQDEGAEDQEEDQQEADAKEEEEEEPFVEQNVS